MLSTIIFLWFLWVFIWSVAVDIRAYV